MKLRWMTPRAARVVAGVGRTLIAIGTILLLFVAYQLWGTGLQEARAQRSLEREFEALVAASQGPTTISSPATSTTATSSEPGVTSPDTTEPPSATTTSTTAPPPPFDPPDEGEPVARLEIPAIGVDKIVIHGVSVRDLRRGPGHYPGTALPGQLGNAAIAGHRTTYGQPFHDLDMLQPGDAIHLTTVQGRFTYRVQPHPSEEGPPVGHFIVKPSEVGVLGDHGDNRLTLTACHPKFSARQRIIVTAELENDPVITSPSVVTDGTTTTTTATTEPPRNGSPPDTAPTPSTTAVAAAPPVPPTTTDLDEGLAGDRSALLPAFLWGLATGGVALAAWEFGRLWRRWPAYLLATPIGLVLLFMCFVNVDRLLPAY